MHRTIRPDKTNNIILVTTHTVTRASRGTRRSNPGQLSTIRRRLPGLLLSDVAFATARGGSRVETDVAARPLKDIDRSARRLTAGQGPLGPRLYQPRTLARILNTCEL